MQSNWILFKYFFIKCSFFSNLVSCLSRFFVLFFFGNFLGNIYNNIINSIPRNFNVIKMVSCCTIIITNLIYYFDAKIFKLAICTKVKNQKTLKINLGNKMFVFDKKNETIFEKINKQFFCFIYVV